MFDGTSFKILFILLVFWFGGCGDTKIQVSQTECVETGKQILPVSCSGYSTKQEILDAFLLCDADNNKEWKVSLSYEIDNVTVALIIPEDMNEIVIKNSVQLKSNMANKQYLVFYDNVEGKLIGHPIPERGIVQLNFYEEKGKLYVGIIYENTFVGWEEFSMKWLCYEKGVISRLWNVAEKDNPYHYWKDRKPVLDENNTISIYEREAKEGSFEVLMTNSELMAMDNYSDYVTEYQWTEEIKYPITQWIKEGIYSESKTMVADSIYMGEDYICPGTELVMKLFEIEEENKLHNPIYFSVGFEGAAVELYTDLEEDTGEAYFIVKKYSSSHQSGFQSLYIGCLDSKQGKITQCLEFLGDHSEAGFVSCRGQQYILFYAETIYNGIPTTMGGILKAENGKMQLVWPYIEDYKCFSFCERYWHPCGCDMEIENGTGIIVDGPIHRTARIEDKKLKIYYVDLVFYPDSFEMKEYNLILEREIEVEHLISISHMLGSPVIR